MNKTLQSVTASLDALHLGRKGKNAFTKQEQDLPKVMSAAIKSGDWTAFKPQLRTWIESMKLGAAGNAQCIARFNSYYKALGL